MPNLRDSLLPAVDSIRAFEAVFGTRRFVVTVRRRVWSTLVPGQGTATNFDIPLTPKPRVRDVTTRDLTATELELINANGQKVVGNLYRLEQITPRYTPATSGGTATGGYLAEQIRMWPNRDTGAVENLVALVGDDGYLRECEQITFEQDRMFNYKMLIKEIDRPRAALASVAVTPATASLLVAPPNNAPPQQQQLACVGTFQGGATSVLTSLSAWTSSNTAVATVDIYGNVTAVAAGTATIQATCLGQSATMTVTVS